MADSKRKPGPKRQHGERRNYHILLSTEVDNEEAMSLADAFEKVSEKHGGIVAYTAMIIRSQSEIQSLLEKSK
jgi:hypothetical protein